MLTLEIFGNRILRLRTKIRKNSIFCLVNAHLKEFNFYHGSQE